MRVEVEKIFLKQLKLSLRKYFVHAKQGVLPCDPSPLYEVRTPALGACSTAIAAALSGTHSLSGNGPEMFPNGGHDPQDGKHCCKRTTLSELANIFK